MGTGASTVTYNVKSYFEDEIRRVKKDNTRNYLTLEEITLLKPFSNLPIDFTNLGTLYALDLTREARINVNDLVRLTEFCERKRKNHALHEHKSILEGLFALKLWNDISTNGVVSIEKWLMKLVASSSSHLASHPINPNIIYIEREALLPLYKICQDYIVQNVPFHEMYDMLQRAAEEAGWLDILDTSLDEYVPLQIVAHFVHSIIEGFTSMMTEIGITSQVSPEELNKEFSELTL